MRAFVSAVIVAWVLAGAVGPARAELRIAIDKSSQKMTVTVDGGTRHVWPVSTGLKAYDTPSGSYRPFRMEESHFSREWDDAPMPHSIFFTRTGHAIHGTTHRRQLGRAASHGCVRLAPGNAKTLFALVNEQGLGTTRITVGGAVAASAPSRKSAGRKPRR